MVELGPLAAPPPVAVRAVRAVWRSIVSGRRFTSTPLLGVGPGARPRRPCIARRRRRDRVALAVAPRGPALESRTGRRRGIAGTSSMARLVAVDPIGQ